MRIDMHFDSKEEFLRHVDLRGKIQATFTDFSPEEIQSVYDARKKTDSAPAEAKVEEEGPAPAEEAPAPVKEEKPKLDESLRVEARKALADLNKKTGKNTAREILKGLGFNSLKEVPLERIPEVMTIAREEEGDAE